jgi:hypothetical protein
MYTSFKKPNKQTMKVLLDIKYDKASSLMDVLRGLSYVKARTISDEKALLIEEIKEAVENLKLVKHGKLKARLAKDLLNEL